MVKIAKGVQHTYILLQKSQILQKDGTSKKRVEKGNQDG